MSCPQCVEKDRVVEQLREQAQLYIDQREMTLAAKRAADQEIASLREQLRHADSILNRFSG